MSTSLTSSISRPELVVNTVRIRVLLIEGNKERTHYFEGTIIAIKKREGKQSLSLRKLSHRIEIEKLFKLESPKIVFLVSYKNLFNN